MYTRVLVALALIATVATALPHNFGEVLACGPTATNYDFIGSSLTIQCSANATFSLSLYVSLQTQFSTTDIKAVTAGVGLSVGFTLAVTPATTAVLQATFVTPSLSATSQLDLEGNFDAGCLQYDSVTKSYNQIDIQSYNFTTNAITLNLPEAGTYVLIAFNSNAYLPAWYGRNHTVHSGSTKKLQFPAGLYVELYSQNDNVLSVNYSTSNPTQVTPSGAVYDYYWVFKSHTEQNINATLKYVYNKTEAIKNNVDQTNLHWEFYDETTASWTALGTGGSVDVQAGVVLQVTPHFSTWTVSDSSNTSAAGFVQVNALLIAALFVCKLLF